MKLLFKFLLVLYLLISVAYFGYKYFIKEDVSKKQTIQNKQTVEEEIKTECHLYNIAYYVDYDKTVRVKISENCFNKDSLALMMYNSEATAILKFKSYIKTSPVGKGKTDIYALFEFTKHLKRAYPDDGDYVFLLFNYKLATYKNAKEYRVQRDDKKLIERLADTIYFHRVDKKTAYKTKLEYEILKVDTDKYGRPDLFAMVNWFPKNLSKREKFVSVFSLYRTKGKGTRYDAISIKRVQDINYNLFQVIDVDGDGIKELIIKKEEDSIISFIVYKFNVDFGYKKIDELEF